MARRRRTLRDLREEADAALARGIPLEPKPKPARPVTEPGETLSRPSGRMKVVWLVVDAFNKTIATYDYPRRGAAELHAARLKAEFKGNHYVRSEKVPWDSGNGT
jgi:hypothetical protein